MKKLLIALAAAPFLAGVATAAEPLSNAQMDRVTAGANATCADGACFSTTGFQIPANVNPTPANLNAVLQAFYSYLASAGFPSKP